MGPDRLPNGRPADNKKIEQGAMMNQSARHTDQKICSPESHGNSKGALGGNFQQNVG